MEYIFEITATRLISLPRDDAAAQVSQALNLRVEQASREQLPNLWKATDHLRSMPKAAEEVLEKRRKRTKLWAILCLMLGIFVFVPGLMEPRELSLLLIGAAAICLSLYQLLRRRERPGSFDRSAAKMLDKLFALSDDVTLRIAFSNAEMVMEVISLDTVKNRQTVPYTDFECVIEMKDLYLLCYTEQGIILPKNCLTTQSIELFSMFLATKTNLLKP